MALCRASDLPRGHPCFAKRYEAKDMAIWMYEPQAEPKLTGVLTLILGQPPRAW